MITMDTASVQPAPNHAARVGSMQTATSTNNNLSIPSGSVTSTLTFYSPPEDGSKPFNYVETPPPGVPQQNFGSAPRQVTIQDIRGQESAFTLDAHAFEAASEVHSGLRSTDFDDDDLIKRTYYPEVENLLLSRLPGAHTVVLFDHTIRRTAKGAPRAPVSRVHIDQTPASAAARVKRHVPDPAEAERLLAGRVRLVNVWRALNGPVRAFPLAVADGSSVRDEDLVGVEHRYPDRTGETAAVRFNEGQRWYYWSGMRDDERLLLKCFDNDEGVGMVGRVPHTAFEDPRTPEGAANRESIEVRALVFG